MLLSPGFVAREIKSLRSLRITFFNGFGTCAKSRLVITHAWHMLFAFQWADIANHSLKVTWQFSGTVVVHHGAFDLHSMHALNNMLTCNRVSLCHFQSPKKSVVKHRRIRLSTATPADRRLRDSTTSHASFQIPPASMDPLHQGRQDAGAINA